MWSNETDAHAWLGLISSLSEHRWDEEKLESFCMNENNKEDGPNPEKTEQLTEAASNYRHHSSWLQRVE